MFDDSSLCLPRDLSCAMENSLRDTIFVTPMALGPIPCVDLFVVGKGKDGNAPCNRGSAFNVSRAWNAFNVLIVHVENHGRRDVTEAALPAMSSWDRARSSV